MCRFIEIAPASVNNFVVSVGSVKVGKVFGSEYLVNNTEQSADVLAP